MTIIMVIFMVSLGVWQLFRLNTKLDIINDIKKKIDRPVVTATCKELNKKFDDKEDIFYSKVKISGTVKADQILFLYSGPIQFKGEPGYRLLAPLKCKDGDYLVADIGWIPLKEKDKYKKDYNLKLTGGILEGEKKKMFTPTNDVEHNVWYYISPKEIGKHFKINVKDFYVMKAYENNIPPIGKDISLNIRNDHLGYAFTWFGMAIALLIIFLEYSRRLAKNERV